MVDRYQWRMIQIALKFYHTMQKWHLNNVDNLHHANFFILNTVDVWWLHLVSKHHVPSQKAASLSVSSPHPALTDERHTSPSSFSPRCTTVSLWVSWPAASLERRRIRPQVPASVKPPVYCVSPPTHSVNSLYLSHLGRRYKSIQNRLTRFHKLSTASHPHTPMSCTVHFTHYSHCPVDYSYIRKYSLSYHIVTQSPIAFLISYIL